jgi:hypothetical protein
VARSRTPIVGRRVPDQRTVRPERPIKDLGEFIAFLEAMEEVFGRPRRRRRPVTGGKFLL